MAIDIYRNYDLVQISRNGADFQHGKRFMECFQDNKGRKGTKFIYLYWEMEDPALGNKGNDTDSEFGQLKKYSKSEIKNEPARKTKRIKKEMNINGGI
jgi:hypothetical protein